jgi:tetratricopeptide (TPR) repeat protein
MAYRQAESLFAGQDRWGKSISIYGRARALNDIGRCDEAKAAYKEYAGYVGSFDPPAANLALIYANDCRVPEAPIGDLAMTELTQAIVLGRYEAALSQADRVTGPAKESGWVDYNRAVALANLGRTNEAVTSYRLAENRFVPWDWFGRSIAIYGRARALDMANRCKEAKVAYTEYANLVRPRRTEDADAALVRADACQRLER